MIEHKMNRNQIRIRREKFINTQLFLGADYIFKFGLEIIAALIEDLNILPYQRLLVYGARGQYPINILKKLFKEKNIDFAFFDDDMEISYGYSYIISFFDLNTIPDIKFFLEIVKKQLLPDGAFLGCLVGETSLLNARKKLWELEEKLYNRCWARVQPMIRLADVTTLFQISGFKNIISYKEEMKVSYNCLMQLLKDLKSMGESGLASQYEYMPKGLYRAIKNENSKHEELFEIIAFYASFNTSTFANKIKM